MRLRSRHQHTLNLWRIPFVGGDLSPKRSVPATGRTISMTTRRKGTGLSRFARQRYATIVCVATVSLVIAGCTGSDDQTGIPQTGVDQGAATTPTSTAPAAPSVSARLGIDLCTLLTQDEISSALGRQGLVPKRTTADDDGHVTAESCDWGSEAEGFISVGWMDEPIPQWKQDEYSRAFTEAIGRRTTVNDWEGRFCAVYAEGVNGNIGVTITPSEEYLRAHPVSPGDGTCDRNKVSITAVLQRVQPG